MSDDDRIIRLARQMVETDLLMGMDEVYAPAPPQAQQPSQPLAPVATPVHRPASAPRPAPAPSPRPAPAAPYRPAPTAAPASASAVPDRYYPPIATTPITRTDMTRDDKINRLAALKAEHDAKCTHCAPQYGTLRPVWSDGDPHAQLMFVGEAPGAEENEQGLPFVGRSGQLLTKQIIAMGLRRQDVYICNVTKVRPPDNRVPTPEEAYQCLPYLHRQIEIVAPKVIVTLGATASRYLLNDPKLAISRARGQWHQFRSIPVMPTFHPSYLLRQMTKENRQAVWDDLKKVLEKLGLPIPVTGSQS
jgi:DNA polymerase